MFGADEDEELVRRTFSRRAMLLGAGQVALLAVAGQRLFDLQVRDAGRYAPLADGNRISLQVVPPRRGRILDRTGELLAGNEESYRVMLTPLRGHDARPALKLLARVVPIAEAEIERIARRAARSPATAPLVIATDVSFRQVAEIGLLAPQLPGIHAEISQRRRYHQGTVTGHAVGYVGAPERLALDDDPALRLAGFKVGKLGVERGMDAVLRGRSGYQRVEVDAKGRVQRRLDETPATDGRDIVLSLETRLQRRVLERLAKEVRAAAVVMELTTGEILAMASHPGLDPAALPERVTPSFWRRLVRTAHQPMVDRTIGGQYPPGSTFKMVTALAALDAGVVGLREKLPCDGSYEYFDRTFRCWNRGGHGRADLHRALRESCDCYFYEIAHRTGIDRLAAMARTLGFGQVFDIGIAPQRAGLVPDPDWKRGRFNRPWTGGETLLAGIGQGYVLATPLQLAVMAARIATGRAVMPRLIATSGRDGDRKPFAPLALETTHLDAVRKGMWAVVNEEGGTGGNAYLDDRVAVAGKTGTSQVSRASTDRDNSELPWHKRDHALFVCYFPADKPRFAISVIVEHGGGGGQTAAPLARDLVNLVVSDDPTARRTFELDQGRAAAETQRRRG